MSEFQNGQRWISDTEPDLGLGTIIDHNPRQITVVFLASGETRIYAKESAPLTRIRFGIGDRFTTHDNRQIIVDEVVDDDGYLLYQGTQGDGEPVIVPESELNNFVRFDKPQDRLFAGQLDSRRWFNLRVSVYRQRHALAQSPVTGLLGARVAIVPHQIYIAAEVSSREAPRVLLADEVGLGKTIEAGMILHRQLRTHEISRVLIVVPEALLHQWLVEMLRRFNLHFHIIDTERFEALLPSAPDANPFIAEQLNLCSLQTLLDNPDIAAAAIDGQWDSLVVDEAHHLAWQPDNISPAYALIEKIAEVTPSVLLLTATPEQLGHHGHFARLRLLDPSRFSDYKRFQQEESDFANIAAIANVLAGETGLAATEINSLEHLLGRQFNDKENSLLGAEETDESYLYRQSLLTELVDRHGTSRVLFRNSRSAISGFPGRKLSRHPLTGTNTLFAVAEWLPQFLSEVYPEKVLLILAARESLELIAEHLRKAGVDSAQFHEGMSIVERDRAAAWFADTDDGAQILLCSEIGSEGRNFQFLHHLVTLELPLRPDVLEQRIGRLDRIGQRHEVQVHVPVLVNSRDDRLLRWYDEGLNAIEQICRVGDTVFSEVKSDLIQVLEQQQPDVLALDQVVQRTAELAQIYNQRLESGRDRLLELNSNRIDLVEEHLDLMHREERSYALPDFMNRVFDCFGLDTEEQSNGSWIVKPTDHMQIASFPGIDADGITLTYSRSQALEREDFAYLTWDHPMVTAGMDLVLNEATGQVNAQVIDTDLLPKGVLYLEAVTTFACSADKSLRIDRYFPSGTRRFLLGSNRKDYSSVLHRLDFDSMIRRTDRSKIKKLVQDSRPSITMLLNYCEKLASDGVPRVVEHALEAINNEIDPEVKRLLDLQRVNPSVRDDEIDRLRERKTRLIAALQETRYDIVALSVLINP